MYILLLSLLLVPNQDKPSKPVDAAEICRSAIQCFKKNLVKLNKNQEQYQCAPQWLSRMLEKTAIDIWFEDGKRPIDVKDFATGFSKSVEGKIFKDQATVSDVLYDRARITFSDISYSADDVVIVFEIAPIQRPWKFYMTDSQSKDYGKRTGVSRGNGMVRHFYSSGDKSRDADIQAVCEREKKNRETIQVLIKVTKGQEITGRGELAFSADDVAFSFSSQEPKAIIKQIRATLVEWKPKK